jgi:DNA-binding GntR family transcriptional regulator
MPSPKHAKLAETLRQRIADGVYSPGTKLPSEAALSDESGASRSTVRQALAALQYEGLLRAESGRGYYVREPRHFMYRPQADFKRQPTIPAEVLTRAFEQETKAQYQRIEVTILVPPDDVRRRLELAEGEFVVRRSRHRFLDGEPYSINTSYYPRDIAEGTDVMVPTDIARGANQVLAERGFAQVKALDEIWLRMPVPSEVDRLDILPGTPVAEHIITGFTAEGRAVRMVRTILPGDRNVILFERTHPDFGDKARG